MGASIQGNSVLLRAFRDALPGEILLAGWDLNCGAPPESAFSSEILRHSAGFSPRRRQEFLAGRWCAARVLEQAGLDPATVISVGEDRQPCWPSGISGSITHGAGWALCIGAPGDKHVGLDLERCDRLKPRLWSYILTPGERAWVEAAGEDDLAGMVARGTAVFSAKEAFYKWQYPQTGSWLGFHDVETRPCEAGNAGFYLDVLNKTVVAQLPSGPFQIRWLHCEPHCLTWIHE